MKKSNSLASKTEKYLLTHFPFNPTGSQKQLMRLMSEFIDSHVSRKCFLLKGYAGTGKTTLIKSLIKTLRKLDYDVVLLAPTGRAAKVITHYTGNQASTIHRYLYEIKSDKDGEVISKVKENKHHRQVFIIDEASMISNEDDKTLFKGASLLADCIDYVYSQTDNFIFFIGDTAQLPPVGIEISPALDAEYLQRMHDLDVKHFELKEVVRQQLDSGILANAHCTRLLIERDENFPRLKVDGFDDMERITQTEIADVFEEFFPLRSDGSSMIICRSNKQANKYNEFIRKRYYAFEEAVEKNERLMVVKNNYYWHESDDKNAFIANGDELQVIRTYSKETVNGFDFMDAVVELKDEDSTRLRVKLLLNTLTTETPALPHDDYRKLFQQLSENYRTPKGKINMRKMKSDPYLNALQVKYAYAITCHKAQGGQWETVFVDPGFIPDDGYNKDYMRWLYTALTRAQQKAYLVSIPERFFVS